MLLTQRHLLSVLTELPVSMSLEHRLNFGGHFVLSHLLCGLLADHVLRNALITYHAMHELELKEDQLKGFATVRYR